MNIKVILGDITKLDKDVDAIVNAANETLLGGGGVDGAIHLAAGPELLEECKTLNGCKTGEAKVTKAYRLKQKYIIHTVGPIYYLNNDPETALRACYRNSLLLADSLNVKCIAFPSISTGVYGYPVKEAAPIAIDEIAKYQSKNIECVIICAYDEKTYKCYKEVVRNAIYKE